MIQDYRFFVWTWIWGREPYWHLVSAVGFWLYWGGKLFCLAETNQSLGLNIIHTSADDVDSSWNVMAHGDAREGKWRGNWWMDWVASSLHTTSEHGVSSSTNADAHTSAASSRLNWRPRRFKWTRPFRRKTKSGFCACAITFQLASTTFV
jgi:hypothetical protein